MEKAIVTFKDPDSDKQIELSFRYTKEDGNLDYDIKLSDGYSLNSELDFIGFLANMFLTSLQVNKD